MTVQGFNATIVDMINDLATAIPHSSELSTIASLASGVYALDPNSTSALDTLRPLLKEYETLVNTRDEGAVIKVLQGVIPEQYADSILYIWNELSDENKATLWQYVDLLKTQALGGVEASSTTKGVPCNSELFRIYNNVWTEFLTLVQKSDTKDSETWERAINNLEVLKTDSLAAVHTRVKEGIQELLTPLQDTSDVMTLILPRDVTFMCSECQEDLLKINSSAEFPFESSLTVKDFIQVLVNLKDVKAIPTYWHYVKVLTTVLSNCPPELADILTYLSKEITGTKN